MKSAVDAGSKAAEHHTLAFFTRENVVIHIRRTGRGAIDGRREGDTLGLFDVVVGFFFQNFVEIPGYKSTWIANAPFVDEAYIIDAGGYLSGERHLEAADSRCTHAYSSPPLGFRFRSRRFGSG